MYFIYYKSNITLYPNLLIFIVCPGNVTLIFQSKYDIKYCAKVFAHFILLF